MNISPWYELISPWTHIGQDGGNLERTKTDNDTSLNSSYLQPSTKMMMEVACVVILL